MGYGNPTNEHDKEVELAVQGTVRWVAFLAAVIIIVLMSLIANNSYQHMLRNCPVQVEAAP